MAERAPESSIERDQRRREQAPTSVARLFDDCLARIDRSGSAGSTWSAGRAWHAVNGDIERAHTTGVYVREPRGRESLPTLLVYVDSRARATDFSVNREVYLARLANVGQRFADVVFRVSKRRREGAAEACERPRAPRPAPEPPELTDEERSRVERMCAQLPEGLRASVFRAMSASIRAEKARDGSRQLKS